MGKGKVAIPLSTFGGRPEHTLIDNLPDLTKRFPLARNGYFGRPGNNSHVRTIASDSPLKTAEAFFRLSTRWALKRHPITTGFVATLKDGTQITIRKVSTSDKSPAIDVNIIQTYNGRIKRQEIHFIQQEER